MSDKILVGNIQRFSLHDGTGIRTTVFMLGCSIHCPWCANPENLQKRQRQYPDPEDIYGKFYSVDELVKEVLKDRVYFSDGGGVTFSGGEALLSAPELFDVWKRLKAEGVNITVETALFIPLENLMMTDGLIDHYLVDVKILEPENCNRILGGNVAIYRRNFSWLCHNKNDIVLRFPVVNPDTMNPANLALLYDFLKEYNVKKIQIFAIHDLARSKYKNLNMPFHEYKPVTNGDLESIKAKIMELGTDCEILQV